MRDPCATRPRERIEGACVLDEREYWLQLEYRLSGELEGIEACRRRGLWCDGFLPEEHDLAATRPSIRGRVWLQPAEAHETWRFTLLLTGSPRSRERIEWPRQLPPADVTRWLTIDFERRTVEIDPGAAVPDATVLERPLQDLEQALRLGGEERWATLVARARAGDRAELESFLRSDELWGGTGSIADGAGGDDGRSEGRREIEEGLLELGALQIAMGLVNERTEMWVTALRIRQVGTD